MTLWHIHNSHHTIENFIGSCTPASIVSFHMCGHLNNKNLHLNWHGKVHVILSCSTVFHVQCVCVSIQSTHLYCSFLHYIFVFLHLHNNNNNFVVFFSIYLLSSHMLSTRVNQMNVLKSTWTSKCLRLRAEKSLVTLSVIFNQRKLLIKHIMTNICVSESEHTISSR